MFVSSQQEDEIGTHQKRIQQLENDLDQAQEQLAEATAKLEESEKKQADVCFVIILSCMHLSHSCR